MFGVMQSVIDRERQDAALKKAKQVAQNLWNENEYSIAEIAKFTELTQEQVKETIMR